MYEFTGLRLFLRPKSGKGIGGAWHGYHILQCDCDSSAFDGRERECGKG